MVVKLHPHNHIHSQNVTEYAVLRAVFVEAFV